MATTQAIGWRDSPSNQAFYAAFAAAQQRKAQGKLAREAQAAASTEKSEARAHAEALLRAQQEFETTKDTTAREGIAAALTSIFAADPTLAKKYGMTQEAAVPPEGAMYAPVETVTGAPRRVTLGEAPTFATFMKEGLSRAPERPTVVQPGAWIYEQGEFKQAPAPPGGSAATPERPWEYRVNQTVDETSGRLRKSYVQLSEPSLYHARRLYGMGVQPETQEWNESMALFGKSVDQQGLGIQGASDIAVPARFRGTPAAGGGRTIGEPLALTDRPVPEMVAKDIAMGRGQQDVVATLEASLTDPDIQKYLGPVAQWYSTVKRYTPGALLGDVPLGVVTFEQNLARLKNVTTRIQTGLAMNQQEAAFIDAELPRQIHQPQEFAQRLAVAKRWIADNLHVLQRLALTGNQRAKLALEDGVREGEFPRSVLTLSSRPSVAPPVAPPAGPAPRAPSAGVSGAPLSPTEWLKQRRR